MVAVARDGNKVTGTAEPLFTLETVYTTIAWADITFDQA